MTGAVAGFSVGFLLDCLLVEPLGGGSLVLLTTGYLAGLFRERFEIHSALVPPLLCMGLTLFAELGFGAVAADARHRRDRQPAGRPRHPDQERLRLLPRLADLPRRCGGRCARPWSRSPAVRRRTAADGAGSLEADVPAIQTTARRGGNRLWRCGSRCVGGIAVALFAVLFFRLWNLQVLAGGQYLAEAKNNRTREFKVIAPRGDILDRDGNVLVDNRTSLALQLNTAEAARRPGRGTGGAGAARRTSPTCRCARCGGRSANSEKVAAGAPVTLRRDVGYDLVYYLEENQRRFPGVAVQRVFVRRLPGRQPRRPRARQRRRGLRRRAEGTALQGAGTGRRGRPGRRRVHLRPLPARAARG